MFSSSSSSSSSSGSSWPSSSSSECGELELAVGDRVVLSPGYKQCSDAAAGPLSPGDIGVITKTDDSDKPYRVGTPPRTWWYEAAAVEKYVAGGQPKGKVCIAVEGATDWCGDECNGTYREDGRHNGKPMFKKDGGKGIIYYNARWKMSGSGSTGGWHYSIQGSGSLPPTGRWTTEGASTTSPPVVSFIGKEVQAKTPQFCIVVEGANDELAKACNGTYREVGRHHDKPMFKKDGGKGIIYYNDRWKMSGSGCTGGWHYSIQGSDQMPPTGKWTTEGASTTSPPVVSFIGKDVQVSHARFMVEGAGGLGSGCDGTYREVRWHNGKPLYKQEGGEGIIYFTGMWKMNHKDNTGGWWFSVACSDPTPPVGKWTCKGAPTSTPPTVSVLGPAAKADSAPTSVKVLLIGITCIKGHKLKPFVAAHHTCDVCKKSQPPGTTMRSCRQCDYDVCSKCVGKAVTPLRDDGLVGVQVQRGPDWEWGDQDGGSGKLGTTMHDASPGWIQVRWDNGRTNSYRAGADGKYDLCIVSPTEAAASDSIHVGDRVRVSASVSSPKYGWGGVKPGMVGVVIEEDGDSLTVNFPADSSWIAWRSDMEKVVTPQALPLLPSPAPRPAKPTFKTSNFKKRYAATGAIKWLDEISGALRRFLIAMALERFADEAKGIELFKVLHEEQMKATNVQELIEGVQRIAVRLWTSAQTVGFNMEFCSLLNACIRGDKDGDALAQACILCRAMSTLLVTRASDARILQQAWPSNGTTYRGSGIPREKLGFWVAGLQYRTPMLVATSFEEAVAIRFLARIAKDLVPVLFRVRIDPDRKCAHAQYIDPTATLLPTERELLFVPYSGFTVREVKKEGLFTVIEIHAAPDNLAVPEDVPLAEWH